MSKDEQGLNVKPLFTNSQGISFVVGRMLLAARKNWICDFRLAIITAILIV